MASNKGKSREFFIKPCPWEAMERWRMPKDWLQIYGEHMVHIYLTSQGGIIRVRTDADEEGNEVNIVAVEVLDKWEKDR